MLYFIESSYIYCIDRIQNGFCLFIDNEWLVHTHRQTTQFVTVDTDLI